MWLIGIIIPIVIGTINNTLPSAIPGSCYVLGSWSVCVRHFFGCIRYMVDMLSVCCRLHGSKSKWTNVENFVLKNQHVLFIWRRGEYPTIRVRPRLGSRSEPYRCEFGACRVSLCRMWLVRAHEGDWFACSVYSRHVFGMRSAIASVRFTIVSPVGLALLAGMVFYYRKYKALEHLYTKAVYQPQDDDQMGVVYDGLASTGNSAPVAVHYHKIRIHLRHLFTLFICARLLSYLFIYLLLFSLFCLFVFFFSSSSESPGVMFSDLSPNKKRYRDAEKIPLGEHDELSMV